MALGPLTVGSQYQWKATLTKNGAVWDLSALTVTVWWRRPGKGGQFSQPADSATSLGVVTYTDVSPQLNVPGTWTFSVFVQGFGFILAQEFDVRNSP